MEILFITKALLEKIRYFNMNNGKELNLPEFKIPRPNSLVDLSPSGEFMIVSSSGELYLCEMATGNFVGIAGSQEKIMRSASSINMEIYLFKKAIEINHLV